MSDIPERDWKYLRTIRDEMLQTLCKRINDEAVRIVTSKSGSQHDKYLRLFKHIMKKDDIVGYCFNDWRRSKIINHILWLRHEKLLTDELCSHLSEETQDWIRQIERIRDL